MFLLMAFCKASVFVWECVCVCETEAAVGSCLAQPPSHTKGLSTWFRSCVGITACSLSAFLTLGEMCLNNRGAKLAEILGANASLFSAAAGMLYLVLFLYSSEFVERTQVTLTVVCLPALVF